MANQFLPSNQIAVIGNYLDEYVPIDITNEGDVASLDLGNLKSIILNGNVYSRLNTTLAADGSTVLIDVNGTKFVSGINAYPTLVLSSRNAPPANPSFGDAHIVGNAPTGAFAGFARNIATFTRFGWIFAAPLVGPPVYNQGTSTHWFYDETGAWQNGFGVANFARGSINPYQLANPGQIAVNGLDNSPPSNPSENDVWIVGASPTGAFAGHAHELAYYINNIWDFRAVRPGTSARDAGAGVTRVFNGVLWEAVGVDNPLVGFRYIPFVATEVVPAGTQTDNQKRVLWTYTIPEPAVIAEIEFPDQAMAFIDAYATRFVSSDFPNLNLHAVLTIGTDEVFRDQVSSIGTGLQQWPANRDREFPTSNIGLPDKRAYVRVSDHGGARDLEFSIQTSGVINIRNVRTINGFSVVKALKTV